jgi:hypothetical protein
MDADLLGDLPVAGAMNDRIEGGAVRPGALALAAAFAALIVLTSLELLVVGLAMDRAARITALAGLLMAKVGLVAVWVMRARDDRRASRFTLTAIAFAAGTAIVLMLETVFRVGVG